MIRVKNISMALTLVLLTVNTKAQILTSQQIDSLTQKTLSTFNVPGIAVAVIKDGKLIHGKRLWHTLHKIELKS